MSFFATYFSFLSKSLAAKTGAFRNVFSPAGFMGEQGGGRLGEGRGERGEGEMVASEEEHMYTNIQLSSTTYHLSQGLK